MGFIGDITGGLIGESSSEQAAKDAKKLSEKARKKTFADIDAAWDYTQQRIDPYSQYGQSNIAAIEAMRSPDAPTLEMWDPNAFNIQDDPSYQFRLSEGLRAADRALAANRNLGSGNRLTALNNYGQNMASTEYANAWRRALDSNMARNRTLGDQYALNRNQYQTDLDRRAMLGNIGMGADQQLAEIRRKQAIDKGNLWLGEAADTTAANMFQAKQKSDFISDLVGAGGMWLGAG